MSKANARACGEGQGPWLNKPATALTTPLPWATWSAGRERMNTGYGLFGLMILPVVALAAIAIVL